jgi:hypothetical protein
MATTTNYSWSTPDDTALVKDGAAAIRTLGSSADTTVKALSPGTTAGDIDYYTTSTTKARVGIGTAGQVLAVNSGATAPEWITSSSGGMTLINTGGTTLTGASVTIGSIPATYKNLQLVINNYQPASDSGLTARFNSDSNTRYKTVASGTSANNLTFDTTSLDISESQDNTVVTGLIIADIYDYANTTTWKIMQSRSISVNGTTTTNLNNTTYLGFYNQTAAISDIVLFPFGGNFTSGTAYLYGVK